MSFQDAVRICLQQKYADFSGRARRSEFWYFFLFSVLASTAGGLLDTLFHTRPSGMYNTTGIIQGLVQLVLLVPGLAVGARRLHDIGRSGFWLLLNLVPLVGQIILVVWAVQDSHPDNQYGPSPKAYRQVRPPLASYGPPS
jgi:uncharacterized membrane protein YhaH (DUF805 family)